ILIHNDEDKITDLGHAINDNMETHELSSDRRPFESTSSSGSMDISSLCFSINHGTRKDPVFGTPEIIKPL
ncbi:12839_t:CDS:2, partial [Racocetra persica]